MSFISMHLSLCLSLSLSLPLFLPLPLPSFSLSPEVKGKCPQVKIKKKIKFNVKLLTLDKISTFFKKTRSVLVMFFSFAVGSSVALQGTVNVQSLFKVNLIYPNF